MMLMVIWYFECCYTLEVKRHERNTIENEKGHLYSIFSKPKYYAAYLVENNIHNK